jgi:hypothetical protein
MSLSVAFLFERPSTSRWLAGKLVRFVVSIRVNENADPKMERDIAKIVPNGPQIE